MFALPGQTEEEWTADIAAAVAPRPRAPFDLLPHFRGGHRALGQARRRGGRSSTRPGRRALYEATWARLAEAGYEQYEISNFARPGLACRHNLNTWRMQEWIGLGPSAASQHGGWRGANIADLEAWRARIGRGERMTEDRVALTPALLAEESPATPAAAASQRSWRNSQ